MAVTTRWQSQAVFVVFKKILIRLMIQEWTGYIEPAKENSNA
jgi:hypothetical protein